MSDVMEPMIHEDQLPGHESELQPKPDWQPRYAGSERLNGKVALITGADSGIGRAVAALFAREGADVSIGYLCEHDDAKMTKEIVNARTAPITTKENGSGRSCRDAIPCSGTSMKGRRWTSARSRSRRSSRDGETPLQSCRGFRS